MTPTERTNPDVSKEYCVECHKALDIKYLAKQELWKWIASVSLPLIGLAIAAFAFSYDMREAASITAEKVASTRREVEVQALQQKEIVRAVAEMDKKIERILTILER